MYASLLLKNGQRKPVCKVGKAVIVDCEVLDRYLETFRLPAE